MSRRPWLPLALCATLLGLTAAADRGDAARTGATDQRGGTLRLSSSRDLGSTDPALAYRATVWGLEYATCAKLYNYPDKPAPAGLTVIPEVAKDFPRLSNGKRTATIELKRTYRFNTGEPVTAKSFVDALNRDAKPAMHSPAATTYMHEIVGSDAVTAGKAQTISGVRAIGPYTLQIRTTRAVGDLPARLTMPFFCPIAAEMANNTHEVDAPPGSGPYYIATRVRDRVTVLERNPFYTGPRPANVDRVQWKIGQGQEACWRATERDEVDYCESGIPADKYREVADRYGINRPGGQFFRDRVLGLLYLAFNHDRRAFKGRGQIPLKQAINWAIDRPEQVRTLPLTGSPTDQILPPGLGADESIYPLGRVTDRSLATARALLAKAAFKPAKLVLYANSCCAAGAETFQYDMRRLGIEVEIHYFSTDTLGVKASTRGEPYDVLANQWGVDYPDAVTFFKPLLDGTGIRQTDNTNFSYFNRPRVNREIERISLLSGEARFAAWSDLDAELMRNDPPFAPFLNPITRNFVSKSFGCYVFQPAIGRIDLVAACKR